VLSSFTIVQSSGVLNFVSTVFLLILVVGLPVVLINVVKVFLFVFSDLFEISLLVSNYLAAIPVILLLTRFHSAFLSSNIAGWIFLAVIFD